MDKLFYSEEELPQRSDKWRDLKKLTIGSSEVMAALSAAVKFEKPQTLWKRKTGKLKPKTQSKIMERGTLLEDVARKVIIKELAESGIKDPKIDPYFAYHPKYDFVAVSFDGVDLENKFITEIKSPNFVWVFRSVFTDGIQDYYYPQVQYQLYVANALWGITKAYYCSYYPDGAYILDRTTYTEYLKYLAIVEVDYDEEYCAAMIEVIKQFYDFIQYDYWDEEIYQEKLAKFKEVLGVAE